MTRPAVLRRAAAGAAAALLLSGCGQGGGGAPRVIDPSGPPSISVSSPTGAGPAVQFRTVRTTGASPADSSELQAFSDLDCAHPAVTPPAQVATACDAQGHKYLLDPAAFTGGVTSAHAQSVTSDGVGVDYDVAVQLDAPSTTVLAQLSRRLTRTHGLLALVVGGRVVAAPEVVSPITIGSLEIQVPGASKTAAEALAAQLTS